MGFHKKIAIPIVGTNAYLPLAIRFIKKFLHYYNGNSSINFYLFTDTDPAKFLSSNEKKFVKYIHTEHSSWVSAANSKFVNILTLHDNICDYVFYFDADTNIFNSFHEDWFIGETVAGEHFANRTRMVAHKPYDQHGRSSCYINPFSNLPRQYYYGAFFGGRKKQIMDLCATIIEWQIRNKKIKHEPIWNDESYLNAYFHYNRPTKIVKIEAFPFVVSDKGNINHTRNSNLNISFIYEQMLQHKNNVYDIIDCKIKPIDDKKK